MQINASLLATAVALTIPLGELACQTEAASPQSTKIDKMSAREFRRLKLPGEEVEKNVHRLTTELRWHKTLAGALAAGRAQGKPVVWIHALGDLEGFL